MIANDRAPQQISLDGDLDIAATPLLTSRLTGCDPERDLVVDVARVTFIDSAGLRELIAAHRRHTAHGSRIVLVGADPKVRRLMTITGLDVILPMAASHAQALQLVQD